MVTAAAGATQLTYRGIIYAGGLQGVGKSRLVPCLSLGWRGPTWAQFYKPLVPEAQAHTGVGNHQVVWRFLWCIVQSKSGGWSP